MRDTTSRRAVLGAAASAATVVMAGCSGESPGGGADSPTDSPSATGEGGGDVAGASVSIAVPEGGASLRSTGVQWRATADGVEIEPSGEGREGAGHYHVTVDTEPVPVGETIPEDDAHVHYGTGQTDGVLELEPGDHTLHLQVGDGAHTATDLTDTVEVSVADEASLSVETTVDGSVVDWSVSATGYDVRPASGGIASNSGHLHALLDVDPVPVDDRIPEDPRHVHFGDGSTAGSLDLAERLGEDYRAGEHRLVFQVGTAAHRATPLFVETTVTTE